MSTHQTLYRKYRSQTLNELVGQPHIIQTLANAVSLDRLHHAYIFSGPRGTGKTSTARILAKMVNTTLPDDLENCPICQKITQGRCVDVIEIDAASNTGVDHMRQLTEQVQFMPVEAKTKVFIIDEVHMLSAGAFNALLKTVEEPPQNTLFILATTEAHKIPATIQSRCQRLHFRTIEPAAMRDHLMEIAQKESIQVDAAAMEIIIRQSGGCMRDALSLMDQLICISKEGISESDVHLLLGSVNQDQLIQFLSACIQKDWQSALQSLQNFIDDGISVSQLCEDVLEVFRRWFFENEKPQFPVEAPRSVYIAWMGFFSDLISELKQFSNPEMMIQMKLFLKINDQDTVSDVPVKASVAPTSTVESSRVPTPVSKPTPQPSASNQNAPQPSASNQNTPQPSAPSPLKTEPVAKPEVRSNPAEPSVARSEPSGIATSEPVQDSSDSTSSHSGPQPLRETLAAICDSAPDEFQMLVPVLRQSQLFKHQSKLMLLLESQYSFFKKKLSEAKYNQWMLEQCSQRIGHVFTSFMVTMNPDDIHQLEVATATESPSDNKKESVQKPPAQSKTVNQIVDMFEGSIIT